MSFRLYRQVQKVLSFFIGLSDERDYKEEEEFRLNFIRNFGDGERDKHASAKYGITDYSMQDWPDHMAIWALTDAEVTAILAHFMLPNYKGFEEFRFSHFKTKWHHYMSTDLCDWWLFWLLGRQIKVHPSKGYERLCKLVKSHAEGTLPLKAAVITQILLQKDFKKISTVHPMSHFVSKYFQKIVSTYLKYIFYRKDINAIMWRKVSKDYSPNLARFVSILIEFYTSSINFEDTYSKVLHLLEALPLLDDINSSTVACCFGYGEVGDHLPLLVSGMDSIIGTAEALFLSYILKGKATDSFKWEMLYNTHIQGASYSTLNNSVSGETSTVIIIEDDAGFVFGAYLDSPWRRGNKFFGGIHTFLFRLRPSIIICQALDVNNNYCYFNYRNDPHPSGVAFGGSMDFFGFHIELDKMRGKCADYCQTFESFECLPLNNYFEVQHVEVWSILPNLKTLDKTEEPKPKFPALHFYHCFP